VVVSHVLLRDFRSYGRQELDLAAGFVLVVGANGAGKTNLLEAVHVGSQGFSFRTRRDSTAVRLGTPSARVELLGFAGAGTPFMTAVTIEREGAKRIDLNGARIQSQEDLRRELPVLAFTPDRLSVVKGGPAVRRTYLDRAVGRLAPAKASVPAEYASALAQRNAALRHARFEGKNRSAVGPRTSTLVRLGQELDRARAEAVAELGPLFSEEAARLGLAAAQVGYHASGMTAEALEARLEPDIDRGTTGIGPHLQDIELTASGSDLRTYGSQGQQRLAVLALLLAEARAIAATRGEHPLLLLDDVLSELDDGRRAALLGGAPGDCQMLVTSTTERAVPPDAPPPAQVIEVTGGVARPR
jgi:DNA replication and repair protein RecF